MLPDITYCKKTVHKCHITRYKKEINQSNTIENTKKVTWLIINIVGNGASFLYNVETYN